MAAGPGVRSEGPGAAGDEGAPQAGSPWPRSEQLAGVGSPGSPSPSSLSVLPGPFHLPRLRAGRGRRGAGSRAGPGSRPSLCPWTSVVFGSAPLRGPCARPRSELGTCAWNRCGRSRAVGNAVVICFHGVGSPRRARRPPAPRSRAGRPRERGAASEGAQKAGLHSSFGTHSGFGFLLSGKHHKQFLKFIIIIIKV